MSEKQPNQPKLADLMTRYLERLGVALNEGLAAYDASGEVVPYEAGPVQPVDPKPAWEAASAVLPFYHATQDVGKAPPQWSALVAAHEPVVAVAFCAGNFPQLMRNFHQVLVKSDLTNLRPTGGDSVPVEPLSQWAQQVAQKKQWPQMLLAVGTFRLAKQFAQAAAYLKAHRGMVPAEWQAAWANEEAALAWHQGNATAALAQWEAQPASVPVLFNRGLALLFLGRPVEARQPLTEAVGQLPESSSWHHLGKLYLALAQK